MQTYFPCHANTENTRRSTFLFLESRAHLIPKTKNARSILIEHFTPRRQPAGLMTRPVEQGNADFFLQLAQANAYGRLRPEDPLGGQNEAAFLHDRDEHLELHELHVNLSFSSPINIEAAIRSG
jgi:hypothetical protein